VQNSISDTLSVCPLNVRALEQTGAADNQS